ncbi:hypothetical protein ASG43_14020 [Aureimonas sp. Leaf454]|uniref:transglycosylase SLT domain-containing protein n=1 Tax=Aureimonas sp. Leaf454 TaxID=1736381 RepID=UPI0006FFA373|nr:transglycosylase SLT domain-containing protein [Aureimonas sp. Leaf454]KQT44457.1 hypothetical protein ASG43_14020 [Aureimonas sp. Leaf454]
MRQKAGQGHHARPERQVGVIALACAVVPFALSACNSSQPKPSLAEKPAGQSYGYAPVRVMAFADGTRIAMPTTKPSVTALANARTAVAAKDEAAAKAGAAKTGAPVDAAAEVAALKADVAERKAEQASQAVAEASAARQAFKPGTPVAASAAAGAVATAMPAEPKLAAKTRRVTEAKSETSAVVQTATAIASVPVKGARAVAGGAKHAVEATIETVGDGAEAAKDVTVAAIDTTVDTAKRVRDRIGDTFKGTDTITGSSAIDRMIEEQAAANNIPSDLAYAVVRVESHYNPTAIGGGAYGLSQIKPATARGLGFAGPAKSLLEPETNLRYGMKYLAGAWEKSGHDVCGTAMRYKGGHRTTRMTKSAAIYCANVKRHMAAIERRRGPANRGVMTAAAEREKTVAVASRTDLPGVPTPTSRAILAAADSQSGRRVASAGPAIVPAQVPAFASAPMERSGRVAAPALD